MIHQWHGTRCSKLAAGHRRGAVLMEVLVTCVIVGFIALGLQAAIAVSLRSIPDPNSPAQTAYRSRQIVDRIATELETAIYVYEHTATTLGMTVADRDGDGNDERIRYAWTGTPGGALTRKYNADAPVTIASQVQNFSLTTTCSVVTDSYPAVCVEDSAESLLVDCYSTSGTSNTSVNGGDWYGQHFAPALPGNAYAWRPTRVSFLAKRGDLVATTGVQTRAALPNLSPASTSSNTWLVTGLLLPTSYDWQSFSFSNVDALPAGGAICLVVQNQVGSPSIVVQSRSGKPGQLRTTNGGNSWTYDSSNALNSRLYGKLSTSSGSQYASAKYLMAMNVSLKLTATSPAIQLTCPALNHPEMLLGFWELKFDRNPTTVDLNGDGIGDWTASGGSFNMSQTSGGVWATSGVKLSTSPDNDFNAVTVADVRFQNTSVGGKGAVFSILPFRAGLTCASLEAALALQVDGTQTLTVTQKTSDLTTANILNLTGLPAQMTELRLIFDPPTSSVNIRVNGVQRGTFPVTRYLSLDGTKSASVFASGSTGQFAYVRVRILEP